MFKHDHVHTANTKSGTGVECHEKTNYTFSAARVVVDPPRISATANDIRRLYNQ